MPPEWGGEIGMVKIPTLALPRSGSRVGDSSRPLSPGITELPIYSVVQLHQ